MLVLDQYACIYKLHWFTLIKNGSSFFLKIRMETESKWKIKPNEMCHTDRQLLGLSPCPPAHLSLHVSWNYHASWWRQLSLLCQRFTKTPPCKSSYLAAILVFPSFYWMGHFHPQHSLFQSKVNHTQKKKPHLYLQLLWWPWDPSMHMQVGWPQIAICLEIYLIHWFKISKMKISV